MHNNAEWVLYLVHKLSDGISPLYTNKCVFGRTQWTWGDNREISCLIFTFLQSGINRAAAAAALRGRKPNWRGRNSILKIFYIGYDIKKRGRKGFQILLWGRETFYAPLKFPLSLYLCKSEFVHTGLRVLHRAIISRCCVLFPLSLLATLFRVSLNNNKKRSLSAKPIFHFIFGSQMWGCSKQAYTYVTQSLTHCFIYIIRVFDWLSKHYYALRADGVNILEITVFAIYFHPLNYTPKITQNCLNWCCINWLVSYCIDCKRLMFFGGCNNEFFYDETELCLNKQVVSTKLVKLYKKGMRFSLVYSANWPIY